MITVYDRPPYKKLHRKFNRLWLRLYAIGLACFVSGTLLSRYTWALVFLWVCAGYFLGVWWKLHHRWRDGIAERVHARAIRKIDEQLAVQLAAIRLDSARFVGKLEANMEPPLVIWRN